MNYYACITKRDDDGDYYLVEFPGLDGCLSQGDTLEEARKNASGTLNTWLEPGFNYPTPEEQYEIVPEEGRYPIKVDWWTLVYVVIKARQIAAKIPALIKRQA